MEGIEKGEKEVGGRRDGEEEVGGEKDGWGEEKGRWRYGQGWSG